MKLTMDDIAPWIIPGVLSVAIHAVIIACFFGFRGCEGTPPPPLDDPPVVADTTEPTPGVVEPSSSDPAVLPPAATTARPKPATSPSRPNSKTQPKAVAGPAKTPSPAGATPKKVEAPASDEVETEIYEVKPGEGLEKIARRYNLKPQELAKLNGKDLKAFKVLQLGQKIKVPKQPH